MLCRDLRHGEAAAGALEACVALGDGFANATFDHVMVFHSLSKRSSAAGLRCGFVAGDAQIDRAFLAPAQLWRLPGAVADPGRRDRVVARRGARDRKPGALPAQIRHRRGRDSAGGTGSIGRTAGSFCGSMSATARRRRCGCGATRRSGSCRAATPPATAGAASIREQKYIRLAIVHDDATLEAAFDRIGRVL